MIFGLCFCAHSKHEYSVSGSTKAGFSAHQFSQTSPSVSAQGRGINPHRVPVTQSKLLKSPSFSDLFQCFLSTVLLEKWHMISVWDCSYVTKHTVNTVLLRINIWSHNTISPHSRVLISSSYIMFFHCLKTLHVQCRSHFLSEFKIESTWISGEHFVGATTWDFSATVRLGF